MSWVPREKNYERKEKQMNIDVPVMNPDGSVKFTQTLDAKQTQALLGFALNFLVANGLMAIYGITPQEPDIEGPQQGELFN